MLERTSPLTSVLKHGRFGNPAPEARPILIAEMYGRRLVQVTSWPDTLESVQAKIKAAANLPPAATAGRAVTTDGVTIMRMGPYRYWVITERDASADLSEITEDEAAVVELTDSRTVLRIQGESPRQILAKGLPIDLHKSVFPRGSIAQGSIGHIGVVVHLVSASTDDTFDLYVSSGFARSFWDWLTLAATEFGYEIA